MKNLFTIGLMLATSAIVLGSSVAADPIESRKALMKEIGAQMKILVPMVKGEAPFDAASASKALDTVSKNAGEYPKFFPDTSKVGGKTEASPKIWENKADFEAKAAKLATDAGAAKLAAGKGLEEFKLAFKTFSGNCASCHESYRVNTN